MLADDIYKTIEEQGEAIYTEKRSKFLAFAIPVTTIEEVKEWIEVYQKKYYDARHVCYAYRLGERGDQERSNDNGEPSGTAGKPILGICRGHQILNVYFGGSLHQDIPEVAFHRRKGEDMTHKVSARADSVLGRLYGESFEVNSVHHQAVKALGEGFRVTADWQGQYAEAIEHCELPVFSVQWHPERICFERKKEGLADGGEIFNYFIDLCKKYRKSG